MPFPTDRVCRTLGLALAAAAGMTGGLARAAPIEAYGRLPDMEDVRLSPDGQRVAYIGGTEDERIVAVIPRAAAATPIVIKLGKKKLRALQWADHERLIVTTSTTSGPPLGVHGGSVREYLQAFLYDVDTGKTVLIEPPGATTAINAVMLEPVVRTVGEHKVIFFKSTTPHQGRAVPTLFRMDLPSGVIRMLDQGNMAERDFMIGPAGDEVAQGFYSEGRWTVKVKAASGWQATSLEQKIDVPQFEGLGPAGDTVFVGNAPGADDDRGLSQISLKDGAWLPEQLHGALIHDPQTGLAMALRSGADKMDYRFFDAALQKKWDAILKAFPGEQVEFASVSADRKVFVVKVFGPTTGAAYMLVDLNTGKGELIGDVYKDLPPAEVAVTTAIAYTAADGLKIPAYLTLPKGREAKGLPLVVLPHDGVASRDALDFDWQAQALASRGYAVLQPEFRGSDGFGAEFREQGFGQWGRKMQTDLSDGVQALAAQGVIDPRRVCIVGQGYGGYAALAGAALQPGVYRCAVSVGGIADLKRMLDWEQARSGGFYVPAVPFFERYMGAESPHDPGLTQISPAQLADRVNIPVLLIHGKDDTVVPFDQSQAMAGALKAAGKPATLVALPGEDHWLSRSDTRLQTLKATVDFLEANNPPDAPRQVAGAATTAGGGN